MFFSFKNGLLAGTAFFSMIISFPALAETKLPEIGVDSFWIPQIPFYSSLDMSSSYAPSLVGGDGGEALSSLVGVSGSRMGGHGIDPVIRGQQQTQLNVLNDGAYVHGACPNRMDPPTSYAPVLMFDSVTVLKGYQSVQYGSGGTGGTVLMERNPVSFHSDDFEQRAEFNAGYQSNGQAHDIGGDVSAGNKMAQIRALWSHFSMNNYEDGDGQKIRSAATSNSYALLPVWTPTQDIIVKASVEQTEMDDVLYAGAGMDSPSSLSLTHRFDVKRRLYGEYLKGISFKAYKNDVDHVMDNFSLRSNAGMKMKTLSESQTFGGAVSSDVDFSGVPIVLGIDIQNNDKIAKRYSGMAMAVDATTPQSLMWPDVRIRQTGFFIESDPALSSDLRLKLGARYDRVDASASAADAVFGAVSANTLYQNHYGVRAKDVTEHNFGGLVRFEYDVMPRMTVFSGLSRSIRTADATERFMAANNGVSANRWVGNPFIDPEKHHQFDVGVNYGYGAWDHTVSGYYDRVSDYIFRDTARGQKDIVATSGETIYRNIDATLLGVDYETSYQLSSRWTLGAGVAWTYGHNRTDGDALSQIPPLEGRFNVDYVQDIWGIGGAFNFAMKQNRIDNDTARRDVQKTPGYGTVDLYAKADLKPFDVKIGVTNLFDRTYSSHLNRSNAVDPTEIQVNEPGRSIGLSIHGRF